MTMENTGRIEGQLLRMQALADLCRRGQVEQALTLYQEGAGAAADDLSARLAVGKLLRRYAPWYLWHGELVRHYEETLAAHPNSIEVLYTLAEVYQLENMYQEADACCERIRSIRPGDPVAAIRDLLVLPMIYDGGLRWRLTS